MKQSHRLMIDDNGPRCKHLQRALVRSLPEQWKTGITSMQPVKQTSPSMGSFYTYAAARGWLEKLQDFAAKHGDALRWNMSDGDIIKKSREIARDVNDFLTIWPEALSEAQKLDVVIMMCQSVGVPEPVSVTAAGAIERGISDVWWRRCLRKKIARVVEHGAIKLGIVSRNIGGYCSNDAVNRRTAQIKRNTEMLKKSVLKNEAGQVFTLASLAKVSTSNPAVRGNELMTRIRGCEEYADAAGHVGTFWALTTPSRFHAVIVGGKTSKARARPNPKYDGVSTPRDAQFWLREQWARARAELAREGVEVYGFRVAEPHHDGTPHWHAMLWFKSELAMHQGMSIIGSWWLKDAGREPGAHEHRVNVKKIEAGGAAGYMAKYVAKNIGHYDVGDHLDTLDGLEASVWAGDVQGWQRVDAWAATWGIRQFQAIGQPSVTVWREMRRVTADQVASAWQLGGDPLPSKIWHAVHKHSDDFLEKSGGAMEQVETVTRRGLMADWARYMTHMGGVCLRRTEYALQPAKRINDVINMFGEKIVQKKVVGLVMSSGHWLISRRQAWARVVDVPVSSPIECAALAVPWSGFNNCTARLTGRLRAALLGLDKPRYAGVDL